MNSVQELSQEMLVRFTQIDYHNEMALIAVDPSGPVEEQIGVARYTTNIDTKSCAFAIVVSDKWRGKGIARKLMLELMEIARDRDLEVMEGQVLSNNVRMLELMKTLNFDVRNSPEDPEIKIVVSRLHKYG
jgi:acetyltransferase